MYLVVLVMDDPNVCSDVLNAWDGLGVPGATILDSLGMQKARKFGARDDIPLMPSIADIFKSDEIRHRTIFSVVPDKAMVEKIAAVTQEFIGDFEQDNTGFMFTVKVEDVFGLHLP